MKNLRKLQLLYSVPANSCRNENTSGTEVHSQLSASSREVLGWLQLGICQLLSPAPRTEPEPSPGEPSLGGKGKVPGMGSGDGLSTGRLPELCGSLGRSSSKGQEWPLRGSGCPCQQSQQAGTGTKVENRIKY